ncbi:helix-turn-helix domain-containing protein [Caldimonas tepidiphila]|uniref:helix-turn-helix domain-containing protein n=1 Tax=Caldimonas tepidiphila TaxID=2315841 RepID=UPI000E5B556B|nr:helix-turn-helix domain-containing protein [Caldimonas tepidiphila]
MTNTARPDTITTEECAELLHCSADQVEELARAGDIPGLKLGRSWLFVRADLLDYLAEKARAEAAERRAKREQPAPAVTLLQRMPKASRRRTPPALPAVVAQA